MTVLETLAALGVATSVVFLVVRVWLLANTLEFGLPPAPPEDPPMPDPAITPSDPFDALLVDMELFRVTNMTPRSTEVQTPVPVARDNAVVAELGAGDEAA